MTSRLPLCLLLLITLLLPQAVLGVSSLVVNGLQGGILTDPRTLDLLVEFDPADPAVYVVIAADLNQDGMLDTGEPCLIRLCLLDNQWADLSPVVGQVVRQFALPVGITGPIVIAAYQQSAGPVQHGYVALPPPGWLTIAGRVVDAAGDPAPGSLIEVSRQMPCLGVVCPDGTYQVAVPTAGYYEVRPLACGNYDYFLPHCRRAQATANIEDINFRGLVDEEWWLVPVEVTLSDTGEPVPGCRVVMEDEWEGYRWMAFTDINGTCLLRVPPWGYYLWPEATPSGAAGAPSYYLSEPPFEPVGLQLTRGDQLVAGTFTIGTAPISTMAGFSSDGLVYTCSDLAGRYECLLPAGYYDFQADLVPPLLPTPPGLEVIGGPLAPPKFASAQSWATYDVTASEWYQVSGTVVRSDDGQPVPWATVSAYPNEATGSAWTVTDGSGAYSLLLPADSCYLQAWSPDLQAYGELVSVFPPATSANIEVSGDNCPPNVAVEVVTSAGLPTDIFTVNGYFQDDDGDFPEEMILYVDGLPYQMEQVDPDDWDSTDGLEFTCQFTGLAPGTHECRVGAWEEGDGAYVESPGTDYLQVTTCMLDSPQVPAITDVASPVACTVHYRGTVEPVSIVARYRLAGTTEWSGVVPLTLTSGTGLDGTFSGEFSVTIPGDYEVRFAATSDDEGWCFAPSEGYLPLAVMPRLSGMSLTPNSGPAGEYGASVDYQNTLALWPDSVVVACRKVGTLATVEASLSTSDTDPTDGASYMGSIGLSAGNWEHQFRCNYRGVTVSTDWITGPQVAADVPQISLGSPAEGSTVRGVVPIYPVISDADGVATVAIRVDGTAIYTWSRPPAPEEVDWGCDWDTRSLSVAEGAHTITIEATDVEGLSCTLTRHVAIDNCTFDDVPKTASYWAYVEAVVREGITSGCSVTPRLFCPNSNVTRGQMAVFLCRAMGLAPYDKPTPTFADVPRGSAQYAYIEAIYRAGITGGCATAPLRYCPTSAVTRGQMAVFLCRAAGISPYANPIPTFGDVPTGSSQYAYVEGLYAAGVTSGCSVSPLMFCPSRAVTRAQMAIFLCRAFRIAL